MENSLPADIKERGMHSSAWWPDSRCVKFCEDAAESMRAPWYPRFSKIEHHELTAYVPDVDAKDFGADND